MTNAMAARQSALGSCLIDSRFAKASREGGGAWDKLLEFRCRYKDTEWRTVVASETQAPARH